MYYTTCATQAFEGVDIVFLVTDFQGGAGHSADTEIMHGKNGIDAAKEVDSGYMRFCVSVLGIVEN